MKILKIIVEKMRILKLDSIHQKIITSKDEIFHFPDCCQYSVYQKSELILYSTSIFIDTNEIVLKISFKECGTHSIIFDCKFSHVKYYVLFVVQGNIKSDICTIC